MYQLRVTGFDEEMSKFFQQNLGIKTKCKFNFANLRSSLAKATHIEEEPKVQTTFEEDVLHAHQTMHSVNNSNTNLFRWKTDDFPTFLK
nr:hypothetical protein [Entomoplasma sp. MP1]